MAKQYIVVALCIAAFFVLGAILRIVDTIKKKYKGEQQNAD